ncbi:MAG: PepSY domain-containing protein [Novosphingobium sp.]
MDALMDKAAFYRTIWRWHFYAGLLVIPFILILSVTGAAYLFKPQVERWEERAWRNQPTMRPASPDTQRDAALAAFPGATFHSYRLPQAPGDAALIHLALPAGTGMRDVFVSPAGKVVGVLNPDRRLMQIVHDIHGELLLGRRGSWLVELAASWAIVMILSGLYLWWPRSRGLAGVAWPRLSKGAQVFWRDLHAVTGFWVAGLALVLLITGLPWAGVWGSAFKSVRHELAWVKGQQDWTIGGRVADDSDPHAMHREHDHAAMMAMPSMPMEHAAMDHSLMDHSAHAMAPVLLSEIVARAQGERLAFPVIVSPPAGLPAGSAWTVKSDAQNRPLRVTLTYDATTGAQTARETFADKHPIDRVVGYGIAWHEGQLLGWFNQLVGVLTAAMLITLAISGFVMWWRRKPEAGLGAPPLPAVPARIGGVAAIILLLAIFLPMLAMSLAILWLSERFILARIPPAARWLGLSRG